MTARSIGSATISFGLVSVPVNLYSSSESSASVSFNMLHTKCGSRLKQQYICSKEGTVVEKDEIGKGYEFSKGQYVRFSAEEIKALDEKATNAIDIAEFVPLAAVDRIYLEKVYYLGPDKGGDRAYRLLAAALEDTGRAALGQYSARGKQYLVLVRPMGDVLVMEQLHYHAELRSADEVPRPDTAGEGRRAGARAAAHRADRGGRVPAREVSRSPCATACSRRSSRRSTARRSPPSRPRRRRPRSST